MVKVNIVRKRQLAVYILVVAAAIYAYITFNDSLKSYFFMEFQKTIPSRIKTDRILFISDEFTLDDYCRLFDRIGRAQNSVALLLPQVFNIKIGDYLENISPEDIKKIQDQYKAFSIKLAETKNIIPVAFLDNVSKPEPAVDVCVFKYFDAKDVKLGLNRYNYVRVKSKRIWMTAPDIAFYEDYDYYPYRVPLLYGYGDCVLVSAAVEGIRKYYSLNRDYVKYDRQNLIIGNIISSPLLDSGGIIVHQLKETPKTYTLNEVLALPDDRINDKIIIVRSLNNSVNTMVSLGVTIASIMQGVYVSYPRDINHIIAAVLLVLVFGAYRFLKPGYGVLTAALTEAAVIITAYLLLDRNIYINFVLFTAVNALTFVVVYFYRISTSLMEKQERAGAVRRFMHPAAVSGFISRNMDIKAKNNWMKTYAVYLLFSQEFSEEPETVKKTFEKVRQILYNNEREFFIRLQSGREIAVVFTGPGAAVKNILAALFEIREGLNGLKFNMVLSNTEVYVYGFDGDMLFADRNYELKMACDRIDKKRFILVPERDVQGYINLTKFQKVTESSGMVLFNIVGGREETVNEN